VYDDFAESYCDSRAEAKSMFGKSGGDRWDQSHKGEDLRLISLDGCIKIDNSDVTLNKLREDADKTGDYTNVIKYVRNKKNNNGDSWWLKNA